MGSRVGLGLGRKHEPRTYASQSCPATRRRHVGYAVRRGDTKLTPGPLTRSQDAKLVAVGIGQDHPAHLALPDVDVRRPK